MFEVSGYGAFVLGAVLIILLPGPNSMYVLTTAAARGVATGYRAAVGVVIGDSILMLASVLGVASLLRANPAAFAVVKYAGALYLAYLGIKLLVNGVRALLRADDLAAEAAADASDLEEQVPRRTRRRGPTVTALVLCLLNPKSILFFVAFFSQFIDPASTHPVGSFLTLAITMQIISVLYLTSLIFGGSFLAETFRRRRRTAGVGVAGVGLAFVGFSAKLATTTMG